MRTPNYIYFKAESKILFWYNKKKEFGICQGKSKDNKFYLVYFQSLRINLPVDDAIKIYPAQTQLEF